MYVALNGFLQNKILWTTCTVNMYACGIQTFKQNQQSADYALVNGELFR